MREMKMIVQRLMCVLAAVVFSAAGAMSMEDKPLPEAQTLVKYVNFAWQEIQILEEDPVLYFAVNDSKYDAKIYVDEYGAHTVIVSKEILKLKNNSICCLRKNYFDGVEDHLRNKKIKGFKMGNQECIMNFMIKMLNKEGRFSGGTSSSLIYRDDSGLCWHPVGTFFALNGDVKASSYFEKLFFILTNDHNSPFTLLPLELRWKIGFHVLGVWAPFERL